MIDKYLEIINKKNKFNDIQMDTFDSINIISFMNQLRIICFIAMVVMGSALFAAKEIPKTIIDDLNIEISQLQVEKEKIIEQISNQINSMFLDVDFPEKYQLLHIDPDDHYYTIVEAIKLTEIGYEQFYYTNLIFIGFCILIISLSISKICHAEKINVLSKSSESSISFYLLLITTICLAMFSFVLIFSDSFLVFRSEDIILAFLILFSVIFSFSMMAYYKEKTEVKKIIKKHNVVNFKIKDLNNNVELLANEVESMEKNIISDIKQINLLNKKMKSDISKEDFKTLKTLFRMYQENQIELKERQYTLDKFDSTLRENKHIEAPKIQNI